MDYDPDEKTHVYIQAATDEALEKGVGMVERLLRGEPEDIDDDERAKNFTLMAIDSTMDKLCSICLGVGHKNYNCPNKGVASKRLKIKCRICGDGSHPTNDCPQKKYGSKVTSLT